MEHTDSTRSEVLRLLDWNPKQYGYFQLEAGEEYLADMLRDHPGILREMLESRDFWTWWIQQWNRRDHFFCLQAEPIRTLERRRFVYERLHSLEYLQRSVPYSAAFNESYYSLVHKIIKQTNANKLINS